MIDTHLTRQPLASILCLLSPHAEAGIGISNKGLKRPLSNVVFLYPSKHMHFILYACISILVEFVGEPLKRFAGSFAGMPTLCTPPPLIGIISGGLSLFKGIPQ